MSGREQDRTEDDQQGQVSEVASMGGVPEPIEPDQAVQGAPDGESGEVEEGTAGPNARIHDNRRQPEE